MTSRLKNRMVKRFSLAMLMVMLWDAWYPTLTWALTSGPAQPEFSSFEPVATTNMVNEFSGDFTYNLPVLTIPGASGGGYAMSLSYHSGASPEEEASWVGYGWTLNPGAINRGKKGFPDDSDNETVTYWNKTIPNRTASMGVSGSFEGFSIDLPVSLNASIRYNNYKGFGYTTGAGITLAKGIVSLGYSVSDGDGSFSVSVNPAAVLSSPKKKDGAVDNNPAQKASKKKKPKEKRNDNKEKKQAGSIGPMSLIGSNYGMFSSSEAIRNTNVIPYTSGSYNFATSVLIAPSPLQAGVNFDAFGNYSWQKNKESQALQTYGYMYAANATSSTAMMDYYVEKSNPFDKRDKYIGIPFSNADNYSLSGEGLGGGFRLYNRSAGHYRPNAVESKTHIINIGVEVEVGPLNAGMGMDNLGVGYQNLSVGTWQNLTPFAKIGDEPYSFRFNNDLGGKMIFGSNETPQQAKITGGGVAGAKKFDAGISSIVTNMTGSRTGRSSYIAYHTNKEMDSLINGKRFKSYEMNEDVHGLIDRNSVENGVGEIAVFNEDGARYIYGLPVYSRKELNMQYGLNGVPGSDIDNNYIAYRNISNDASLEAKVGEERNAPYATSYLLTEIASADYVDRTMDGPTADDYGGYTRFSYDRAAGTDNKVTGSSNDWYKWRIPYNGLIYNRGELSNPKDDMGSVTYGEKEIYYLDTVETKTHYAVFRTSNRADGYDSYSNNDAATNKTNTVKSSGIKYLKQLDRIDLYAKNSENPAGPDKLIKSVRFEYYGNSSEELCKDLPNASTGRGKLSLKKVWFEYDGIYNAKISPYIFEYKYPATIYPTKYSTLDNRGAGLNENPGYTPHILDAWGNYQDSSTSATRFSNMQTWLDQTPPSTFDPAAWQLKVIKLPTGGEIHVQYEQDDYAYVQDQAAEAMVSLLSSVEVDGKYFLNLADIFPNPTSADKMAIRNRIKDLYQSTGKKMYFKILYKLLANAPSPSLTSCASEYVQGYCTVQDVGLSGGNVYVVLKENNLSIPRKVCREYVKKERAGNINTSGVCDPDAAGINFSSPEQVVMQLMNFIGPKLIPGDAELCTEINPSLSYLRIPLTQPKKGGGVRVKRLLMYDEGMETGDKVLFGSEYDYKLPDGTTSGVATNEPSAIREENALVQFDPKKTQSLFSKIVAGKDKEQHELPLGETILPAPSVGYSRVVTKNIHTGKTNTGFVVKEFFTAKDYPVTYQYTPINTKKDYMMIPAALINYFVSNLWNSQGFVFKLNSMHGQVRSETTYAGDPSNINAAAISSQQVFEYFKPGEKVPMMNSLNNVTYDDPGKEMEVAFESRKVSDVCNDLAIEFDVDVGLFGIVPIPMFTIFPSYTYTESQLYTHSTSKVINYPAIQKSVLSYADGIYHLSENVAFNPHNGKPMVTRTTDGYDKLNLQQSAGHKGDYMAYTFPASQQYKDMGQKAKNERKIYSGSIEYHTDGTNYWLEFINGRCPFTECSGDLIMVRESSNPSHKGIFHTTDSIVGGTLLYIKKTRAFGSPSGMSDNQLVSVEVLRSGCTNQLNSTLGGFTTYNDTASIFVKGASINIADREWLRDTLNYLKDHVMLPVCPTYVTIPNNKIRPGITVITGGSVCDTLKELTEYGLRLGCDGSDNLYIILMNDPECFSNNIGKKSTGCFILDDEYELKYQSVCSGGSNCGTASEIPCLNFCPDYDPDGDLRKVNVVAANAQTFSDEWAYDGNVYPVKSGTNRYENGMKGKWRQQSSFVYRDSIIGANAGNQRNYKNAGVFELQMFNWRDTSQNDTTKWIKINTVTNYSPDGNAMEEKDVMGIYSSAKFGYDHTQPYLVAKNAEYQSVQFDGFERVYGASLDTLEDGWVPASVSTYRKSDTAHSGKYSWKLTGSSYIDLKPLEVTQQLKDNGLLMKVWVKDTTANPTLSVRPNYSPGTHALAFKKVARTGDWILYETKIDLSGETLGTVITPKIINNYSNGTAVWIDDVRYQPADAQMITYVYEIKTLRLITTFDDQHFGLYYQYNAEGKLVRKQVETEKGLKTITETQYHTPTSQR